jgi:3-isopropylmalate dehydratase small subunit
MKFTGRVWVFGDDVDTDQIIPARYLTTSDPEALARHCMEDADPGFPEKVRAGDIIVAGKNFGSGSSREHAPIAIKAAGVSCVIAESFARIFFRNAFNMGLPIFICEGFYGRVKDGDVIHVDGDRGEITIEGKSERFTVAPIPSFMQTLIDAGGLMPYVKKELASQA